MADDAFDIQKVAQLARIQLTEQEQEDFAPQLAEVLDYVRQLETVDVDGIEPTAHAAPVFDVTRPDVSRPSFTAEEALANAPHKTASEFLVTKVVD